MKIRVPNRELKSMVEFYKTKTQNRETSGEKAPDMRGDGSGSRDSAGETKDSDANGPGEKKAEGRPSVKEVLEKSKTETKEKAGPAKTKGRKKSEPEL